MNRIVIVALGLGVLAGLTHFAYAKNLETEVTGGAKIDIVVSTKNLKVGDEVSSEHVALRQVPAAYVDARDVTGERLKEIVELPLMVSVASGDTLQWSDFESRRGERQDDLADYVASGQRAMTIVVNSESSMGGLLRPGHRVDIIGTFLKSRSIPGGQRTLVLLQNITVLATGAQLAVSRSDVGYNTVTLGVNIEQGELLAFAGEIGSLSLVLRGYQDLAIVSNVPSKAYDDVIAKPSQTKSEQIEKNAPIQAIERLNVIK